MPAVTTVRAAERDELFATETEAAAPTGAGGKGNEGVANNVAQTKGSIGYVEYAYAKQNKAVILFDSAYEAYIRDPQIPHSIYEIPGARDVAIEFRSFSKTAGFTGTRCAYTVVPKSVVAYDAAGNAHPLHALWNRRHTTKFNGVAYPIQKAAAAIYTDAGKQQTRDLIDFYLANAKLIREAVKSWGFTCIGGDNAPYLWINTGRDSWE